MGYQGKVETSQIVHNQKANASSAQRTSKVKEVEKGQNGNQNSRLGLKK